jgi:hypothetical protein
MESGAIDAWLVHLLEGTDQVSRDEFDCLKAMGLVRKELVIIHGIALADEQLEEMAKVGAKLVTSPLDNLLYYGQTPNLVKAHQLGMNVSLGTDWSPAGSKNLLFELKVLDRINQQALGKVLTDRDMLKMVTANPADAIGWTDKVGRIKEGNLADLAAYKKKPGTIYRSVIDATEADVELVVIDGQPLYGDADAMKRLKRSSIETIPACGASKAIDIVTTSKTKMPLATLRAKLDEALRFEPSWMVEHYAPAQKDGWTLDSAQDQMKKTFPRGLASRTLDTPFACEDDALFDEVRSSPNVRSAFSGLCLDLRDAYGKTDAPDCGASVKKPAVLTVAAHPGTVPQRPAAWCAQQDWSKAGDLPKP